MKLYAYLLCGLLAVSSVGAEVLDSTLPEANSTEHGLTITANTTDGAIVWTNTAKVPIRLNSVLFDSPSTTGGVVGISMVRLFDVTGQFTPSDVTTNEFGNVVTNVYNQATNWVAYMVSNSLVATSIAADGYAAINHLTAALRLPEGLYSRRGDVWYFQAGTGTTAVIADFSE